MRARVEALPLAGAVKTLAGLLGSLRTAPARPAAWREFISQLKTLGGFSSAVVAIDAPLGLGPPLTYASCTDPDLLEHYRECVKELESSSSHQEADGAVQRVVPVGPLACGRPAATRGIAAFVWIPGLAAYSLAAWRSPSDPPCGSEEIDLFELMASALSEAASRLHLCATARCERDLALTILDDLGIGALLVEPCLHVLASTSAARSILSAGEGLTVRGDTLRATRPEDDAHLRHLVRSTLDAARRGERMRTTMIALHRSPGIRPLAVAATADPFAHDRSDPSIPERIALLVSDGDRLPALPCTHLEALYELTPAEAELAALLAAGLTVEEAAARRGITVGTARVQLKSVFAKTDTHRQSELVRVLATLPALRSHDRPGRSAAAAPR